MGDGRQGTLEDFWIGDNMSDDYDNFVGKKAEVEKEGTLNEFLW